MRLAGIASIKMANAFLPGFVDWWNANLAVAPRDAADAHRPFADTPKALDDCLARREHRTLSKALTFRADGTIYCVRTKDPARRCAAPRSSCAKAQQEGAGDT